MAGARLTLKERKSILKWYIKFENVAEVSGSVSFTHASTDVELQSAFDRCTVW
jgi:hypothetical protein